MKVREIMTKYPTFCIPTTTVQEAAKLMRDHDCGELPIVQDERGLKPIGVITDRDIACRAVALGRETKTLRVSDCMSSPALTVSDTTDIDDLCRLLEKRQIRRVPVVDKEGRCCGIVAQADIARHCAPEKVAEVLREVSGASA